MVSALITVAVIAWCAQLALGGWQISRFNRALQSLWAHLMTADIHRHPGTDIH
ncbi:transcriptional regulator GutM, partial [Escherichia coli]|uniref:transcriptional regulator GutM n=1 Tax=Escherichia coli TaxID=562 RepID=UPI002B26E08D